MKSEKKSGKHKAAPTQRGQMSRPSTWSKWYTAALVMPVIAVVVALTEANQVSDARLPNPVPAMGAFVSAECITYTRRGAVRWQAMHITYAFIAEGYVKPADGMRPAETSPKFTGLGATYFSTRADCEAALPAARAAKRPQQMWFERDNPFRSSTTLEEPNSWRLLLIGLFGIPFFAVGWWLRRRER